MQAENDEAKSRLHSLEQEAVEKEASLVDQEERLARRERLVRLSSQGYRFGL